MVDAAVERMREEQLLILEAADAAWASEPESVTGALPRDAYRAGFLAALSWWLGPPASCNPIR